MKRRSSPLRRVPVFALTALIATLLPAAPVGAASRPAPRLTAKSVTMTVEDVTPSTPRPSHTKQPLTVVLSLHNNTTRKLRVEVAADRGDPIGSQAELNMAFARRAAPSPDLVAHVGTEAPVTLLPASTLDVVFRTTTDIPRDAAICLCHDAIYPLYFTATTVSGSRAVVGTTQTYLPVFGKATPQPVLVGWVWPLLDRPHRLTEPATGTQTFLDDDLATEVADGGRLDKMLSVVERVAGRVDLTIVLDPNLVDELAVMSEGSYLVQAPAATGTSPATVAGSGTGAAAAWLQRLRAVLDQHPNLEIDFTPYADPDVESLNEHDLSWTGNLLSPTARSRVTTALGGRTPPHDIAWPVGQTLSAGTLSDLTRQGARTVILDAATLSGTARARRENSLAPLRTPSGSVLAAVTSAGIQRYVSRVLEPGGPGIGELPQLVSAVAIRAVQSLDTSRFVVITASRYLDPDTTTAVRAILTTADTTWSRPLALRAATTTVATVDRGAVHRRRNTPQLPGATLASIDYVSQSLPGMRSMFSRANATALLGPLPAAMQRAESSALLDEPARSITQSALLEDQVRRLLDGVTLVQPANGTYTLTSSDSFVPITVKNTLGVGVRVRVSAHALNQLPGLTADTLPVQAIAARSTEQVNIPTHIVRTGRIDMVVQLSTPRGMPLGGVPKVLTVRGTALGTVGVAITTTAGVVLVLALVLRAIGYLRRRNKPRVALRVPDDVTAS